MTQQLTVELVVTAPDGSRVELATPEVTTLSELLSPDFWLFLGESARNEFIGWRERFKGYPEITG